MDIRKHFGISRDQKIKKIKPGHGNCCTCQTCGFFHDDCVCWENDRIEVAEYVEKLQSDLKAAREEVESLNKAITKAVALIQYDGNFITETKVQTIEILKQALKGDWK